MNKEIVLSTNNKHKLQEFRTILGPLGYTIYSPTDLNIDIDIDENGKDYYENSFIKAKTISKLVPFPVIADDSGLEVIALDRFPGLKSARFASRFTNYEQAGKALNSMLKPNDKRDAEFHCVICYLKSNDSKPLYFEGICKGLLLENSQGQNGFGYDPFFYSEELKMCLGLADEKQKNTVSHRAKAIYKLKTFLSIK